ncbi:hypothetical protein [Chromobacterium vaccinii]|uniref:Cthe-2314-like HEPN domain-containing protein n=1 Tax=Chromobacterium vaccinii TaxID=1108595 RepID=A0A1D9LEL7_9NEIS|nr:hypothetical protein [Chromobacterium vaccinii]AOZ49729.1 hypothetical protein BKX93_06800 [Chromobacterium vaccinii]
MEDFDAEKLLNTPIEAFDFSVMIGDVLDLLEFAEENLSKQYQAALEALARHDLSGSPSEYKDSLEANLNHRFQTSLPLQLRYGALIGFVTTVEWAALRLNEAAITPAPTKAKKDNESAHLLRHFTREAGIDAEHMLQNYEALVHVRNCIAHRAGLHATYKHGESLCNEIKRLSGIYFGNWHFLGDQICIERGALTPYMHQMADFLPKLHASLRAKSMLTD